MAIHKKMGIENKDYENIQKIKAEDDFKSQTNQRIQNLQFSMDKVNELLNQCVGYQGSLKLECNTQINSILEKTVFNLHEFRQILGDIKTDLNKTDERAKELRIELSNRAEISFVNEKISILDNKIDDLSIEIQAMSQDFNSLVGKIKADIESRLRALKDEILSMPSELPEFKSLMNQKLELVELNGQNAVVRSSNNERQIMLAERKIENLYRLVKQLEIHKQESK